MTKKGTWYVLPKELVAAIVLHHHDALDYLRARLVCKRWDKDVTPRVHLPLQPPFLMLPSTIYTGPYFNLAALTVRQLLTLETTHHAHCFGSSRGWLFLLDLSPTVSLFNPITRAEIRLPNLDTIPSQFLSTQRTAQTAFLIQSTIDVGRKEVVKLAVLSSDPIHDPNFVAFISLAHFNEQFFYCRRRTRSWTPLRNPFLDFVCRDVNHQSQDRLLYAISSDNRRMIVFDFHLSSVVKAYSLAGVPESDLTYLVGTPAGDMLIVTRDLASSFPPDAAIFNVYRLELERNNPQASAKRVQGIGDYALFVGVGQSLCIDAREFPEFHGNHIYYIFEYEKEVNGKMVTSENVARFSLATECPAKVYGLDKLPLKDYSRDVRQCWWISPNLAQMM
ncbi:uncharacterized protein [Typha latifolia]|uniref:uncharacterized protein n=1 Tax=Typha latifolia TaxID=4733 RepID=UPI003C2F2360